MQVDDRQSSRRMRQGTLNSAQHILDRIIFCHQFIGTEIDAKL